MLHSMVKGNKKVKSLAKVRQLACAEPGWSPGRYGWDRREREPLATSVSLAFKLASVRTWRPKRSDGYGKQCGALGSRRQAGLGPPAPAGHLMQVAEPQCEDGMGTIPHLSLCLTSYSCFSVCMLCVCVCVCEKEKGRVIFACCEALNKQIVITTAREEGKSEVIF